MDLKIILFFLLYAIHGVRTAPRGWTADIPDTVSALEGSCVVIPCAFRYPSPQTAITQWRGSWHTPVWPKYIYSQDPAQVAPEFRQRTGMTGDLSAGNCTLWIDRVQPADAGPFCFRIEMPEYDRFSYCKHMVSIAVLGDPEPPSLSVSEVVRVGEAVLASCSVSHSCPSDPPHLTWSHSGTPTVQSQQQTDGQWEVTSSLTFSPTMADHKKPLICTAAYRGGKKGQTSKTLSVKYAPVAVKAEGQTTVKEGHSVELKCSSNSNPAAHSYQWHTSSGALQSQGQTYRLERVSRHTEALYCTAFNTEGQGLSSPVQFNVLYPPEIRGESVCTNGTTQVMCQCVVDAHPPAEVTWTVPESAVPSTSTEGSVTTAIVMGEFSDEDTVSCSAINDQGETTLTLMLL